MVNIGIIDVLEDERLTATMLSAYSGVSISSIAAYKSKRRYIDGMTKGTEKRLISGYRHWLDDNVRNGEVDGIS